MTLFVDFDIKEVVSELEELGISTAAYEPKIPDSPVDNEKTKEDGK